MAQLPPANPQWGVVGNEDNPSIELLFHFANKSDGEILIHEFYEKSWALPPEHVLRIAVIIQAINDQDLAWFMEDQPRLVSFQDCCDLFGYNIGAARKAILRRLGHPEGWKKHLYDSRLKDAKGCEFSHPYGECNNRCCAECEFRRLYSERNPNKREWKKEYQAKYEAKKKKSILYKAGYVGR